MAVPGPPDPEVRQISAFWQVGNSVDAAVEVVYQAQTASDFAVRQVGTVVVEIA